MTKGYISTKNKIEPNIKKILTTMGQNIIDRADEVSKNCNDVSKITITAEIVPNMVASYSIIKDYYVTINIEKGKMSENEN